jgi:phosphonate transport system substrate-binding protein
MNEPCDDDLPVAAPLRILPIIFAALGLLATLAATGATGAPVPDAPEAPRAETERSFKIALTANMFTEVNESEARAALKVWIMTVAKERGIPVNPELVVYNGPAAALRAADTDQIDGYGASLEEFSALRERIAFDRIVVATRNGSFHDSYVVLVRADSGWTKLADLRGRDLLALHNPRMSMAFVWLDTVLLEEGLGRATAFFGSIENQNKPSRVALPVFFHKAAVCLMTLKSFAAMQELNPQLGKQLRVLAQSPELMSSVFAFRADFKSPYRKQMFQEMQRLPESPAGQQILTLLQSERIEEKPLSTVDGSLALLARHRQLCAATPDVPPGASAPLLVTGASGKN